MSTIWKELAGDVSTIFSNLPKTTRKPVLLEVWYFSDTVSVCAGGSTNHALFADDCLSDEKPLETIYERDEESALRETFKALKKHHHFLGKTIEGKIDESSPTEWDMISKRLRETYDKFSKLEIGDPPLVYIVRFMTDGKVGVFFRNWANFKRTFQLEGKVYENEYEALIKEEKRIKTIEELCR